MPLYNAVIWRVNTCQNGMTNAQVYSLLQVFRLGAGAGTGREWVIDQREGAL